MYESGYTSTMTGVKHTLYVSNVAPFMKIIGLSKEFTNVDPHARISACSTLA
jgi:hypothetical protein